MDVLYRLVDEYYPAFLEQLALDGRSVPGYVRREFEAYLQCGGNFEETVIMGRLLDAKGIPCHTDIWGRDSHHQWPYWKLQTRKHFARVFG